MASRSDEPGMLSFQRLDVYQRTIELVTLVAAIVDELPPEDGQYGHALTRAAESVALRIAQGAGQWSQPEGAKFYEMARGAAMKCAACLDVLKLRKGVGPDRYRRGMELLES